MKVRGAAHRLPLRLGVGANLPSMRITNKVERLNAGNPANRFYRTGPAPPPNLQLRPDMAQSRPRGGTEIREGHRSHQNSTNPNPLAATAASWPTFTAQVRL